jgi:sec-independent protein translocase protein TatB
MFGFGFSEILTVVIVALVLINPKDLPKIMRKFGEFYGKMRDQLNGIKEQFNTFDRDVKYLTEIESPEEIVPWKKDKTGDT